MCSIFSDVVSDYITNMNKTIQLYEGYVLIDTDRI